MRTDKDVKIPCRATRNSSGYDFYAPCDIDIKVTFLHRLFGIMPTIEVGTGIYLDGEENVRIPMAKKISEDAVCRCLMQMCSDLTVQWFLLLVPKSGLGFKYGLRLVNTCGIIDQDYRGEIRAKLTCDKTIHIKKGEKFMQGILLPYGRFEVEKTPDKERGTGGFGSTGL